MCTWDTRSWSPCSAPGAATAPWPPCSCGRTGTAPQSAAAQGQECNAISYEAMHAGREGPAAAASTSKRSGALQLRAPLQSHLAARAVPQEQQPPLLLQNLLLARITHAGRAAAGHLEQQGSRGTMSMSAPACPAAGGSHEQHTTARRARQQRTHKAGRARDLAVQHARFPQPRHPAVTLTGPSRSAKALPSRSKLCPASKLSAGIC